MTYQLSNRRDRRTFDIAPALEMLEKFVEKKRKEKELEKVTNLLSQSFSNLNNPDELVKVNTEIVNKILTDPELGQDTKNYGLQLANVYSNLKSKELEYNMKKELSQLGGSILKEREFLYPTLEGLTVKKGEEIFNEYKSKYPNIPDETLWSVIEKGFSEATKKLDLVTTIKGNTVEGKIVRRVYDRNGNPIKVEDTNLFLETDKKDPYNKNKLKAYTIRDGKKITIPLEEVDSNLVEQLIKTGQIARSGEIQEQGHQLRVAEHYLSIQERKRREEEAEPMTVIFKQETKAEGTDRVFKPDTPQVVYVRKNRNGTLSFFYEDENQNLIPLVVPTDKGSRPLRLEEVEMLDKRSSSDVSGGKRIKVEFDEAEKKTIKGIVDNIKREREERIKSIASIIEEYIPSSEDKSIDIYGLIRQWEAQHDAAENNEQIREDYTKLTEVLVGILKGLERKNERKAIGKILSYSQKLKSVYMEYYTNDTNTRQ